MLSALNTSVLLVRPTSCNLQLQLVRWRKPRWIPVAKSKMFKVPVKTFPTPEEKAERDMLLNKYDIMTKSLWHYAVRHRSGRTHSNVQVELDDEIASVIEENEKINAEVRARREKIDQENWIKTEQEILAKRAELEREELERLERTEEDVKYQMERLKSAITLDSLDEAIEKALAQEVDYNFAIDKTGNVYAGRFNAGKISHPPKDSSAPLEPLRNSIAENTV